jgi:HEAT repeat protein
LGYIQPPHEKGSSIKQPSVKIGPEARDAIPCIVEIVYATNKRSKAWFEAWGLLERFGKAAVPFLCELLREGDPKNRQRAGFCILRIEEGKEDALPHILAMLQDTNKYLRDTAAGFLGFFECAKQVVIPHLIEALSDVEWVWDAGFREMKDPDTVAITGHEVRKTALESLAKLTGADFAMDAERWRQWYESMGSGT